MQTHFSVTRATYHWYLHDLCRRSRSHCTNNRGSAAGHEDRHLDRDPRRVRQQLVARQAGRSQADRRTDRLAGRFADRRPHRRREHRCPADGHGYASSLRDRSRVRAGDRAAGPAIRPRPRWQRHGGQPVRQLRRAVLADGLRIAAGAGLAGGRQRRALDARRSTGDRSHHGDRSGVRDLRGHEPDARAVPQHERHGVPPALDGHRQLRRRRADASATADSSATSSPARTPAVRVTSTSCCPCSTACRCR